MLNENSEDLQNKMEDWQNKIFNFEEALERLQVTQKQVEEFKEKARKSKEIPKDIQDELCLTFMMTSPSDMDKSVERLEFYFKCKKISPEFFKNRDVKCQKVQETLNTLNYVLLPTTSDGSFLLLHRLSQFEPKKYNFDDAVKVFIMVSELAIFYDGPRTDQVYLFDLKGMSFGHLFRPAISSMMKGMKFLEDGCPLNVKEIHVFNSSTYLNLIIAMIRPFTRSKLLDRIHFHSSDVNWDDFHKKHIPKSHLPSDYGGDLESVDILHGKTYDKLMDAEEYFKYEESIAFAN